MQHHRSWKLCKQVTKPAPFRSVPFATTTADVLAPKRTCRVIPFQLLAETRVFYEFIMVLNAFSIGRVPTFWFHRLANLSKPQFPSFKVNVNGQFGYCRDIGPGFQWLLRLEACRDDSRTTWLLQHILNVNETFFMAPTPPHTELNSLPWCYVVTLHFCKIFYPVDLSTKLNSI